MVIRHPGIIDLDFSSEMSGMSEREICNGNHDDHSDLDVLATFTQPSEETLVLFLLHLRVPALGTCDPRLPTSRCPTLAPLLPSTLAYSTDLFLAHFSFEGLCPLPRPVTGSESSGTTPRAVDIRARRTASPTFAVGPFS